MCKGGKALFGKIQLRNDESLVSYPNIKKAYKHFNWKPKTTLENGLRKTIKYYKKNT